MSEISCDWCGVTIKENKEKEASNGETFCSNACWDAMDGCK
jgi:hypothetical protein